MTARLKALGAVLALLLLAVAGYVGGTTAERDPTAAVPAATQSRPVDPSTSSGDAATRSGSTSTGLPVVDLDRLPVQARRTVALIDSGGPFPYAKDGATFGNRERLLPLERSGYYREYTVPTPGSDDRGARRVIAGDGGRQLFYTDDHYASFVRIRR